MGRSVTRRDHGPLSFPAATALTCPCSQDWKPGSLGTMSSSRTPMGGEGPASCVKPTVHRISGQPSRTVSTQADTSSVLPMESSSGRGALPPLRLLRLLWQLRGPLLQGTDPAKLPA